LLLIAFIKRAQIPFTYFHFCYYSKDLIIECFFSRKINYFSMIHLIIGTILTVSYSFPIILIITNKYLIINVV